MDQLYPDGYGLSDSDDSNWADEMKNLMSNPNKFFAYTGLPAPSSLPTPTEVQQEACELSNEVLSHWTTLQKILERHEELLRKRWMKKSKAQRMEILLKAWPNLPSTHRPDYLAFRKESPEQRAQGTKFKGAYMWPYINAEDLAKGKTLLLFINSRGRHPPSMFSHADFEAMRIGRVSGAINLPFLNEHTMLLDGETVESYGKLLAWANNDKAFDLMISGVGFIPGQGLAILEVQREILRFLVECCKGILHHLVATSLTDEQIPVKPAPPAIVFGSSTDFPSLAHLAAEAPYRVPAQINFERLKAVIAAKRSDAEDHIWALREDPGYFSDVLGDWSEHRQETLLDANGMRHPVLDRPLFWERVIGSVIIDAYGNLIVWDLLCQQISKLSALKEKYSRIISPKRELPPDYMTELLTFRYMLDQTSKGPILTLKTGIPASPPLRSQWVREPDTGSNVIRVRTKKGVKTDPMMWVFQTLCDDHRLTLCGLPDLMDELERVIESDSKQKERLSAWVARVISDLGVIARARHEIDLYQPWAAGMNNAYASYHEKIEAEFAKRFATVAELIKSFKGISVAKVGMPSDGRFRYPSDKRRTRQNTEIMRQAEQNLDLFWQTVDAQYKKMSGKHLNQVVQYHFKEGCQLERTPEWIEPIKEAKIKKTTENSEELYTYLTQSRVDPEKHPSKEIVIPKTKLKTRGVPQSIDTPPEQEQTASQMPDVLPIMRVDKRAFKVFSTLFRQPSQSDHPGETPWTDFLHAMASTGFGPEKLYGSVWQFTPTKLDVERSIQFHEPHPHAKIPFRNARRIGRRLNRAYGWHGGMFVLE
jgi:hypothetical protein